MVGPIIRINPHEVHIRDPDYYETIYSTTRLGIDKPSYAKYQFSAPGAIVSTPEHELHRQRKTVLNPFFSKRAVLKQARAIQGQVDKFAPVLLLSMLPRARFWRWGISSPVIPPT